MHTLEILTSPEAQIHEETDLKHMMPHLYKLIYSLYNGDLSEHLNKLILKNY